MKLNRHTVWKSPFFRFVLAGSGSLLLATGGTLLLTDFIGFHYLLSYALVLTFSSLMNFFLGSKFVFRTRRHHIRRFRYYLGSFLSFYLLDILGMGLITEKVGFHYLLSITAIKTFLFVVKYFVYKGIIFSDHSFLYR